MQFKKIAFFAILSLLLFSGCNSDTAETKETKQAQKEQIYKLTTTTVKTLKIKPISDGLLFEDFKGKAILLNFFATWCPPCKAEIPHLNKLREKYKDQFEIIAVVLEQDKDKVELEEFINEFGIQYVVTNSAQNFELAKAVGGVKSIPTMFLYNKDGKLMQKYVGMVPEEMMEIDIKKAIK